MLSPEMQLAGILVYSIFIIVFLLELSSGLLSRIKRPARDIGFMVTGLLAQSSIAGGVIGTLAGLAITRLYPDSAGGLSDISFWVFFPCLFVLIEFLHYCVHRLAHEWRPLWKVHRTHHSAMDMSVMVLFRYNIFWAFLLPQTWFGAFAVYLGQGYAFVTAILITFTVNALTHMNFRWDLWLRRKVPAAEPVWRVIEKVITLPDTHHAHHGLGKHANVQGNYAITIFLFDTLLGTSKIPHCEQEKIGMANSERLDWKEELFWPIVRKEKAKPNLT